jgi:Asp-tRNA(Asn)/Glu-tRNA(Gln) amidotransferase A subunit family amidase
MRLTDYGNRLLQNGDVETYVSWLMATIAGDAEILSLVPEAGPSERESRLRDVCQSLLTRFPDRHTRPDLFAVPVGVKDIISVDGLTTHAGSALPSSAFSSPQASVVSRLLEHGAIVLGKTVTAEFACMEPNATSNPRNQAHTPGGSSSGSAAAVAAGFCPIALGTQTVGSIIRPAAFCGVFGFKASFDRIPTDGILYYSRSTDHVGLISDSMNTMKTACNCLVDNWRGLAPDERIPKLGIPVGPYLAQVDPVARESFEFSLSLVEKQGISIVRIPMLDDIDRIAITHNEMTAYEFAREHDSLYRHYGALYRPISSALVRRGRLLTSDVVDRGHDSQTGLRDRLTGLMDDYDIDAFASPAATGIAPRSQRSTGNPAMNLPWTHAGVPVFTLPVDALPATGGSLPLGLQLAGRFGQDEHLLRVTETLSEFLHPNFETAACL